jgi:hypothetical protein
MTKKYSQVLTFTYLGLIFTLSNPQTFATPICDQSACLTFLQSFRLSGPYDRAKFCKTYGRTENFDLAALICEAVWKYDAGPNKLCELSIKAAKADNKCP